MRAPGPESEEANPGRDQWVVTPDRCGGWMLSLYSIHEDGRYGKELPTLGGGGGELQG